MNKKEMKNKISHLTDEIYFLKKRMNSIEEILKIKSVNKYLYPQPSFNFESNFNSNQSKCYSEVLEMIINYLKVKVEKTPPILKLVKKK